MAKEFTVTVIGDLNLELVCQLEESSFIDISQDTLLYQAIKSYIGGTASNFAIDGLKYYREVHVLGKLGADALGEAIISELRKSNIYVHCNIDPKAPTGLALYLRDSNTTNSRGTRLLIVQTQSANRTLSVEDVEQYAHILAQSDLLILDGYSFLDQPRKDAIIRAMQIAHANHVVIAFDILPHNAYNLYSLDTLKSMVAPTNVLITELVTIRRFLGFNVPDYILEKEIALETAAILESEFKNKAFLLRFGIGNCDQSLVCLPGTTPRHSFTGYGQAEELRGFGDRLSARELAEILPVLKAGIVREKTD